MINAGKYNKRIKIYSVQIVKDAQGFQRPQKTLILEPYANIRTTKGMTIIKNNSDFEKALTNFTIRFPKIEIKDDYIIEFAGKTYEIQYLNNIDEMGVELEIQAKETRLNGTVHAATT